MITKKGISPLIATVLIIGFTIVLAAVVMQWGGSFVKQLTEEQAEKTEAATACINVNFDISSAEETTDATTVTFSVSNNADQSIDGFIALLDDGTNVISLGDATCGTIGAYETATDCTASLGDNDATTGDKLKLVPKIGEASCPIDVAKSGAITPYVAPP